MCVKVIVEVREASPAHYLLKIESLSLLSESGIDKFESNEFESCGYKWKMILYPDGNVCENGSEHISVYLAISGTSSLPAGWEVNAIFTFFLFNQLCDNYLSVRGTNSLPAGWEVNTIFTFFLFNQLRDNYLPVREIFVIQRQEIGDCLSMVKSNDSFKREWRICNFSNVGEDWLSEEFTVGDHKWILLYPKGNA
ncbi:hypothetical protein K7X08_025250 [Anisodus acutangulus]|uniref:MATH domain-containing protein n=1 Tax=Anisodus acutangulus TaxID=402998 RepID=A0A9Q1RG31_9SOLA|nr:hypothetical protein K7X08_025250 [Anisodus acutangulus]